jgi:thymidylate kinase
MEYRREAHEPILSVASLLFQTLNDEGVRYGVFKSSRNTAEAVFGMQDLDILIAREDYRAFCEIVSEFEAIRSVNHPSLTSLGREDWFIPDFDQCKYLHLDVHSSIRLGGKFGKRHRLYSYGDIQIWRELAFGDCSIPAVSSMDEARITLSRIAFRTRNLGIGSWSKLQGAWKTEIDELLFSPGGPTMQVVGFTFGGENFQCHVKKEGGDILVNRRELSKLRRLIRDANAAPAWSIVADWLRNAVNGGRYLGTRFVNRLVPGLSIDRRCPVTGGLIVAIVGPDGMGKSTQVKRMRDIFAFKFSCLGLYLGSGDGEGWWLRRLIRLFYIRRRSEIRDTFLDGKGAGPGDPGTLTVKKRVGAYLLGLWGVLIALERYNAVRKARRKAACGFLVFCDRWPQSLGHGFLDGPTRQHNSHRTWLRTWELSLYERMNRFRPDVMVQLVADHAVSAARKPGELQRGDFEKRIDLMTELRKIDPRIQVVDAGDDLDTVSRSLFKLIWEKL